MGRGDNKTKRGKISNGTFGVSRPHKTKKAEVITSKETAEATATKKPAKKSAKAKS